MNEHKPRPMVREIDPDNEHELGLPCGVYHPDAGGRCPKAAALWVYGVVALCPEHGEEARIGAEMELRRDAAYFFDRFRNPYVPELNDLVEQELAGAVVRMNEAGPNDSDYYRALSRAYPDTPERVREIVRRWREDERGVGGVPPLDLLLDSLNTLAKLLRIAHDDGEDWLVEILEYQRQHLAAQAAYALELDGVLGNA